MFPYSMVFAKLGLGLLALILQINLLGKRNLAPSSALDQIQNYVLGGIIGGVIYNDTVSIIQFLMILVVWTILVMVLKFLKANSRLVKILVDGKPVILIEQGELQTETCLRYGIQAFELWRSMKMPLPARFPLSISSAKSRKRPADSGCKARCPRTERPADRCSDGGKEYPLPVDCRWTSEPRCIETHR